MVSNDPVCVLDVRGRRHPRPCKEVVSVCVSAVSKVLDLRDKLIDLERQLNGPYALAGLSCEPSITLLDYVRLPLLDASQFAFRPVPTLAELVEESRHDENEPGASKRQAALRRLMRNLRFVLVQLQASSPACARALAALMEG